MKKTAIFISLLVVGAFVANAQDETSSPSTKKQNETKAPSSTTTSPSRDAGNTGTTSTSEGTLNTSGTKSMYNGTKLEISDLPKVVSDNISSQHQGWTTQEVYKIDNQGATAYEVVVKKNEQELNLVYDANGNLLRTDQRSGIGSKKDAGTKESSSPGTSGSSTGSGSTTPETETR